MALSLESRQALIETLGRYTRAGIGPAQALEAIAEEGGSLRKPARQAGRAIAAGATLTDALEQSGAQFSEMERAILEAGETGGRLEAACRYISGWLAARVVTRRQIVRRSLYPMFLLHFAALVGPLPRLMLGKSDLPGYLLAAGSLLLGVYLGAILLAALFQLAWTMGQQVGLVDRLWRAVPVVRGIWRDGALARFCGALDAQIEAGISPVEALPRAGRAARTALLETAARRAVKRIDEGHSLVQGLRATRGALPKSLLSGLQAAEQSGQLDEELSRWSQLYQENEAAAWEAIGDWTPKLIYLAIAVIVGWQIITAAQGVLGGYQDLLEGI